jgi:hypothetical protein
MKSKLNYYLAITIPLLTLGLLYKIETIDSSWFFILLLVYVLIYRTYIDGKRLVEKGIIKESEIWKMVIPGQRYRHFRELYLH